MKDRRLVLTVTKPGLEAPRETEIVVRGGRVRSARATVLAAADVHAHNNFQNPRAVEPREEASTAPSGVFVQRFAPVSVTRLGLELG